MAIPDVNLNVDPRGYAGSIASRVPVYGGATGPRTGGGGNLLERIMRMRERQANAELEMMRWKMMQPEQERKFQREMLYRDKQERRRAERRGDKLKAPGRRRDPQKRLEDLMLQDIEASGGRVHSMEDWSAQQSRRGRAAQIGGILSGQTGRTGIGLPPEAEELMTPTAMRARGLLGPQEYEYRRNPGGAPGPLFGWNPYGGRGSLAGMVPPTGSNLPAYGNVPGAAGGPVGETPGVFAPPRPKADRERNPYGYAPPMKRGSPMAKILGSFETGGGVPKTGTYRLHKGEIVIPTKDVDEDLVGYLTRKKIYDRAFPKGKGSPIGSYQGGTLEDILGLAETGDTAAFREVLRAEGLPESEINRVVNQATRNLRGQVVNKQARAQNFRNFLKTEARAMQTTGGPAAFPRGGIVGGLPGERLLGSGTVPPERAMVPSQAPRAMTAPPRGPGVMSRIPGKLPGGNAAILGRLRGLGGGKMLGAAAAPIAGAVALSQIVGDAPEREPETLPGKIAESLPPELVSALPILGLPQGGLRALESLLTGESVPQALGGAVGARFQDVGKSLRGGADVLGELAYGGAQGLTGAEEPGAGTLEALGRFGMPPEAPTPDALPSDEAISQLAGMVEPTTEGPAEGSYEAAAARVAEGDFGTPGRPLKLTGQLSDIEQAQRDVESLPMYQDARRKRDMAEREANSIYSMLSKEGRAMSPDVYQDLMKEADRKMKLSKGFQGILDRQEKATQAMVMSSEKVTQGLLKEIYKQQAMGTREQMLETLRQQGRINTGTIRGFAGSLPRLYAAAASGDPSDRGRAEEKISEIFKIIAIFQESRAESAEDRAMYKAMGEQSEAYAEQFTNLDQEEAMAMAQSLLTTFSAQGELKGMVGGR